MNANFSTNARYLFDVENRRIKLVLEEKIQRNTDERTRQVIRNDNEIQNDLEDAPRRKKSSEQTDHKAARSKEKRRSTKGWRKAWKSKEESWNEGPGGLRGNAGKFPLTSRRFRPTAFPGRVPWIVKRVTRFALRRERVEGRFVDISSSLYGTRTYIPDKSTEVVLPRATLVLFSSLPTISEILLCTFYFKLF